MAAIRAVWRGEDFEGEFVRITGVRLDFAPPRPEVPIYLAVSGPKSLAYAGEVASGVILDVCTPVAHVEAAARAVRGAARGEGREPGAVEIAGMVLVGVEDAERTARSRLAPIVATYLTWFPTLAAVAGLPQEEIDGYVALAETDSVAAVAAVLPDEVIDRLTVNGSPGDASSGSRSTGVVAWTCRSWWRRPIRSGL